MSDLTISEIKEIFEFYGSSLITCHEELFRGGENEIQEITERFYHVYMEDRNKRDDGWIKCSDRLPDSLDAITKTAGGD